jgi:glutaredoxin
MAPALPSAVVDSSDAWMCSITFSARSRSTSSGSTVCWYSPSISAACDIVATASARLTCPHCRSERNTAKQEGVPVQDQHSPTASIPPALAFR